jgi:hypothetical protein
LCLALPAAAGEGEDALAVHRLQTEVAERIQSQLLAPILGPGRSTALVKLDVELKHTEESASKSGAGSSSKDLTAPDKSPERLAVQKQEARDERTKGEATHVLSLHLRRLEVVVVHDQSLPADALRAAEKAIVDAYRLDPKASGVRLVPAPFAATR